MILFGALFVFPYFCEVIIKTVMVMKQKRRFNWVVKVYDVKAGSIEYRSYYMTISDINWLLDAIREGSSDYVVSAFKLYKKK